MGSEKDVIARFRHKRAAQHLFTYDQNVWISPYFVPKLTIYIYIYTSFLWTKCQSMLQFLTQTSHTMLLSSRFEIGWKLYVEKSCDMILDTVQTQMTMLMPKQRWPS